MLGRYPEALQESALFEKGSSEASVPLTEAQWLSAFFHSRLGQYQEAERIGAEGIREARTVKNPNTVLQFMQLSVSLAMERGDFSRTVDLFDRASATIDEVPNPDGRRVWKAVWHWNAGVSESRQGRIPQARARLADLTKIYKDELLFERSLRRSLEGEIALAAGDLAAAESAFAAAEPEIKAPFFLNTLARTFFENGFESLDGGARVKAARGDLTGAIGIYRSFLTPDIGRKWTMVLEPRYVLAMARLLDKSGDHAAAKVQYLRFLDLWKDADPSLPEIIEAKKKAG